MTGQVMQGDTLAEVHCALVECLPIQVKFQVVLEVYANVRTSGHRPECRSQLFVMHPDLDVLAVQELVQAACVVKMQMPNDDLLDVLEFVTCSLYCIFELMFRLIPDPRKDVCDNWTPYCRVIDSAACLPKDEAFMWVVDQNAVHGQLAALVDERLVLCAHQAGVAAADDEPLISFQPADFEQVHLGAFRADIGDMAWNGASVKSFLNASHVCDQPGWKNWQSSREQGFGGERKTARKMCTVNPGVECLRGHCVLEGRVAGNSSPSAGTAHHHDRCSSDTRALVLFGF
jgi:hypothetical protein